MSITKSDEEPVLPGSPDSSGEVKVDNDGNTIVVPFAVQAATLLMIGFLYKDRDENANGAFEMGYLPKPVMSLLYPLRTPALG